MKKMIILILLSNYVALGSDWQLVEVFDNTQNTTKSNVQSIQCYDSNNCYAIVQHATKEDYGCRIYFSTDGGKLWDLIETTKHESPRILNVKEGVSPNPGYYFVLSDDETFLEKSTDGGKTFKTIMLDPDNHYPDNIAMYNTSIGIVINSNSIYKTTDGWETFERHPKLHKNQTYYSPVFLDSNTVVMSYASPWASSSKLGERFVQYKLKENRWDTLSYFQKDSGNWFDAMESIYFVNDTLCYASGWRSDKSLPDYDYYDIVYKTTDGGYDWELIHKELENPEKGFFDIAFADENNGVAVGYWGKIARTNDGGETWVYERPEAMEHCRKMLVCWAGRTPLIGTWDAGIFRYEGDFFNFPDDTSAVRDETEAKELAIYPNPASDYIEIRNLAPDSSPQAERGVRIAIYDVFGRKVKTSAKFAERIDVSDLPPGMYFVRAGAEILKFVKM